MFYVKQLPSQRAIFAVWLSCFDIRALLLYRCAKRCDLQNRYQDYRGLCDAAA
jgi:hypothetical protein